MTAPVLATTAARPPIETDALVIGAGPAGLFQVFQLGLLEMGAHVVDSLPQAGGQCVELYADKPIYDIPGVPLCTGRELVQQLQAQIAPFKAPLHLGQVVTELQRLHDGRFMVHTSQGLVFHARVVVIAAGVGAFQPRPLKVAGLEVFSGTQLHYQQSARSLGTGRRVLVVGGGDAAIESTLALARPGPQQAAHVTLLHRRDAFDAAPEAVAQMHALAAAGQLDLVLGQPTGIEEHAGRLSALQILDHDGQTRLLALDLLLVLQGLSPRLGPVADWGLALQRKQLVVDTEKFQTSEAGIFAVGDINTYPGKKKLILSAFHEATLAAFGAAQHAYPARPQQLQYTTTSPRLQRLLGVVSPPVD